MNGVQVETGASVEEIYECLHELQSRDDSVKAKLDGLLQERTTVHRELQRLDLLQAQLATQQVTARNLLSVLGTASSTASRISSRVSALDVEQSRVKQCLAAVEDVAELKTCVLGVHQSMENREWETAASYIGRSRKLGDGVVKGQFAESIVPTSEVPDAPSVTLERAAESLGTLFLREFNKATEAKDVSNVTRYFKLFPLIGKEVEGLDVYSKFVCSIVATRARSAISGRLDGDMVYANLASRLFEHIASIIDQHSPLVDRHYGQGKMLRVIERLIGEADRQGGIIIDTWWDERAMARRLNELRSYAFSFLVQSFLPGRGTSTPRANSPALARHSEDEGVDVKEIDVLLNEMSIILSRWSLFSVFLARKWHDDTSPTLQIPSAISKSHLAGKISGKVIPAFESSATFFFRRSVEKAFQLSEFPDVGTAQAPLISSSVDDIMYILQKTLQRTLSSGQLSAATNIVANIRRVMEGDFLGMIQRRLRDEYYPNQITLGVQPTPAEAARADIFMVLLNDLALSATYARRILRDVIPNLERLLPFGDDAAKVRAALDLFLASFDKRTGELISEGVTIVFSSLVKAKLRQFVNGALRDNYIFQVTPDQRDMRMAVERGWQLVIGPCRRVLCREIADKLLQQCVSYVARVLERKLWSMAGRVNEVGAISLERDVATLVAVLADGQYALREKLDRYLQICTALNVDDEREFGEVDWKLGMEELVKARRMRID